MGRVAETAVPSQRCRIQPPLAVAAFVLACLVSHACGSCLSYGHSCWGAHGKRSGGGGQGARWNHVGRDLIDAGSDRISRGVVPQGPASSPPTPDSEDTLWLISKLMAATTQLEPQDGGGGGEEEGGDGEEDPSEEEEEDEDPDPVGAKIWRRLLDVNHGARRVPKFSRTTKVHLEKVAVPTQTELSSGVGIIGIASAPNNGELGRGLVVVAEYPEEEEDDREGMTNDFKGGDIPNEDEREEQEGKRLSRKALRRLRILNLWDSMDKRSN